MIVSNKNLCTKKKFGICTQQWHPLSSEHRDCHPLSLFSFFPLPWWWLWTCLWIKEFDEANQIEFNFGRQLCVTEAYTFGQKGIETGIIWQNWLSDSWSIKVHKGPLWLCQPNWCCLLSPVWPWDPVDFCLFSCWRSSVGLVTFGLVFSPWPYRHAVGTADGFALGITETHKPSTQT